MQEVTDLKDQVDEIKSRDSKLALFQLEINQMREKQVAVDQAHLAQLNQVKELQMAINQAHIAQINQIKVSHKTDKKSYQAIINDLLEEVLITQLNQVKDSHETDKKNCQTTILEESKIAESNLEPATKDLTTLNRKYEELSSFILKNDEQI